MIYVINVDGHAVLLICVVFISLYMNKSYLFQIVRVRKNMVLMITFSIEHFDINKTINISCRSEGLKHLKRRTYVD